MLRDTSWTNEVTGEVATGLLVVKGAKYPRGVRFATVFLDGLQFLASLRLPTNQCSVLLAMIAHLGFENVIAVSQATLAEEIGIAPPNVARAVKALVAAGLVSRESDPKDRRRTVYRLNPFVGWMGNAKQWATYIQTQEAGTKVPMPSVKRPTAERRHPDSTEDIERFVAEHGITVDADIRPQA